MVKWEEELETLSHIFWQSPLDGGFCFCASGMFSRSRVQVPNTLVGEVLAKSKGVHPRWNLKEAYGKLSGLRTETAYEAGITG